MNLCLSLLLRGFTDTFTQVVTDFKYFSIFFGITFKETIVFDIVMKIFSISQKFVPLHVSWHMLFKSFHDCFSVVHSSLLLGVICGIYFLAFIIHHSL